MRILTIPKRIISYQFYELLGSQWYLNAMSSNALVTHRYSQVKMQEIDQVDTCPQPALLWHIIIPTYQPYLEDAGDSSKTCSIFESIALATLVFTCLLAPANRSTCTCYPSTAPPSLYCSTTDASAMMMGAMRWREGPATWNLGGDGPGRRRAVPRYDNHLPRTLDGHHGRPASIRFHSGVSNPSLVARDVI